MPKRTVTAASAQGKPSIMAAAAKMLRLRVIGLGLCGVVLAWLVLSRSLAAYLADGAPQAALWLNRREPTALLNLADRAINAPLAPSVAPAGGAAQAPQPRQSGGAEPNAALPADAARAAGAERDFAEFGMIDPKAGIDLPAVRAWAEAAVLSDPLNARALRILGQTALAAGDVAAAARLMQMAAQRSLHQSIAVYWLLAHSAESNDYKATLTYADVILRTLPGFDAFVMPALARIAGDGNAVGLLKATLADDPPWRSTVLQNLPRAVVDERILLDIFVALRRSQHPPTAAELDAYLNFLVEHRMYELGYYTWLQFLRPDQLADAGLVYNGDFELPLSGAPFDWHIEQGFGVSIDVAERPDKSGDHALSLAFESGRVEYHSVKQLLMLTPGRYQLRVRYKGELIGSRGLKWRLACAESPERPFAETAMISGRAAEWSGIDLDFAVPPDGCRAQHLSLDLDARMPSEQFVSGTVWFDDLRIQRLASASSE
jgi:hypothetical protein